MENESGSIEFVDPDTGEVFTATGGGQGDGDDVASILVIEKHKAPHGEEQLILRKYKCRSIWCHSCYSRGPAKLQARRMNEMVWNRTRALTLTLDRMKVGTGEEAYLWFKKIKPRGRFIQNLKRKGVIVEDWTSNLEWHADGTPHLHMLIQVKMPGKSGMIGNEIILECWPWGLVHETYFRTKKHFEAFVGYFGKTGYLHQDKHHQVQLPDWALAGFEKINRFSSMRNGSDEAPPDAEQEDTSLDKEIPETPKELMRPYGERHKECGEYTDIFLVDDKAYEYFLKRLYIPYKRVTGLMKGDFVEHVGFVISGDVEVIFQFLAYTSIGRALEKYNAVRGRNDERD